MFVTTRLHAFGPCPQKTQASVHSLSAEQLSEMFFPSVLWIRSYEFREMLAGFGISLCVPCVSTVPVFLVRRVMFVAMRLHASIQDEVTQELLVSLL